MRQTRLGIAFMVAHWIVCAVFLVMRPADYRWLEAKEQARKEGAFLTSSGEPLLHLAGRPLYGWSRWHGGEQVWVKAIEVPNILPIFATKIFAALVEAVTTNSGRVSVPAQSWLAGGFFFVVSSLQWFVLPRLFGKSSERRLSNSG